MQPFSSDTIKVYVSDTPASITKKLQHQLAKKFEAMTPEERNKQGGSPEYGIDPQRWILYQNKRMFKLTTSEQIIIDNYDRLQKHYHDYPLIATYFLINRDILMPLKKT